MLRKMLRDKDAKSKLRAGELLLRYRSQLFVTKNTVPTPMAEADREWADLRAMAEETRERMDRLRARDGLPPLTDEEFREQWDRELYKVSHPSSIHVEFDENGEALWCAEGPTQPIAVGIPSLRPFLRKSGESEQKVLRQEQHSRCLRWGCCS